MKKLFSEFTTLNWVGFSFRDIGLEDLILDEYILARLTSEGLEIIWLANGNHLKIPWEWIDLFSSFNTINGEKVMWLNIKPGDDDIDKTIYRFTYLINTFNWSKGKEFLDTLADICSSRTDAFIKWFSEKTGETLKPLELRTADNIIEI